MSRDYSKLTSGLWTGRTGRAMRGNRDAQVIACYVTTCSNANMIGLYYLPLPTLCHEIGITLQGASKGLRRLSEAGFCHYDAETEHIWVPNMARFQIGEKMETGDNRVKGIQKLYESLPNILFTKEFYEMHGTRFHLTARPDHLSPFEGASKALQSQEQEQEQEKEQEQKLTTTPLYPPKGGKPKRAKLPKSPFPEIFEINDDDRQWFRKNFGDVPSNEVMGQIELFRDHHISNGNMFNDWKAAWRKWMRKWMTEIRPRTGQGLGIAEINRHPKRLSPAEERERAMEAPDDPEGKA